MAKSCLRSDGLAVGHDGKALLSDLALHVEAGSCWALVGPNGAGKSTLIRALAGLHEPLAGQVWLGEKAMHSLSAKARAALRAFVPQHLPNDLAFGVEELVRLSQKGGQRWWATSQEGEAEARQEAMAAMGLEGLGDRPLPLLSGGQRQRAFLAAALATRAPLLLLDEPTAHLDMAHQLSLLRALESRRRQAGEAFVLVLHDLNLAAQFADALVLLGEGGILAQGPVADVLRPELLRRAFGLDLTVHQHPQSGRPYLLPLSPNIRGASAPLRGTRRGSLHLVVGGGSGDRLLPALHRMGFHLSVGALNLLDGDAKMAEDLGLDLIAEAPFSPIGPDALKHLKKRLREADAVVVGDVAWGPGNLANLQAVVDSPQRCPTFLLTSDLKQRDFTQGQATALWACLQAQGAVVLDEAALLRQLANNNI